LLINELLRHYSGMQNAAESGTPFWGGSMAVEAGTLLNNPVEVLIIPFILFLDPRKKPR
jgi:hypothetical protein